MKDIDWELKNLDSLKELIFVELIGEHPNTADINKAINTYAEAYHEMKLKLLGIADIDGRSCKCGNQIFTHRHSNWIECTACHVIQILE
jgi:hypothetical protein